MTRRIAGSSKLLPNDEFANDAGREFRIAAVGEVDVGGDQPVGVVVVALVDEGDGGVVAEGCLGGAERDVALAMSLRNTDKSSNEADVT
jgi:hypothetical protein